MRFGTAVAVLVLGSSGCAGVQPSRPPATHPPLLKQDAQPEAGAGYLAGQLSATPEAKGFGFGIVDGKGREWVIPFDDVHARFGLPRGQPALIALPPGEYRVAYWTSERLGRNELPRNNALAQRFVLAPGKVVFLGAFSAAQAQEILAPKPEGIPITTRFSIQPVGMTIDEARRLLRTAYPGFANAPFQCLQCGAVTIAR